MPTAPKCFRSHALPRKVVEQSWESRKSGRHGLYNLAIWKHPITGLRIKALMRDSYLCQECKRRGIIKAVKDHTTRDDVENQGHADHIKDHNGDWELFVDIDNIETKCGTCHNRKTGGMQNVTDNGG